MRIWNIAPNCSVQYALHGFYNAYFIKCNNTNILIDTGRKSKRNRLLKNLAQLIPNNGLLDYLILTHSHYDHCENAAHLKKVWPNCKVVLNTEEQDFMQSGQTPLPRGTNAYTYWLTKLGNRYASKWYIYDKLAPDITYNAEYIIPRTAEMIKVITTPGHSIGSSSIIINNNIAIIGDSMFGARKSIYPHFADNETQLLGSWEKLLKETSCHVFLPGHGRPITRERLQIEFEKRNRNENLG